MSQGRIAVDIGGTFTDIALELADRTVSAKVLTTPAAPEEGVMTGIGQALAQAAVAPAAIGLVIHGTTLATNAIIERRGARTALIATRGFRDAVEMAFENRFEQYDIFMDRSEPLVPREWRHEVTERIDARGKVLLPLAEDEVPRLAERLAADRVEALAIGMLHSYVNPAHEQRLKALLSARLPELAITLSSEVCPEIREYERFSTACANAYVQPVMARYLGRLDDALRRQGFRCRLLLMTSGGGLTTLETARRQPIRLVESGPAGGAILAGRIASSLGLERVVSFDMGGTTAKICLIDHGEPQHSRSFEVARQYRFLKGSGLPLRIPVIEMVEIGAGGGSIAQVDAMARVTVGPESAGAEPGPACYGRGGSAPTVTDADLLLGRIDARMFAGGRLRLDAAAAQAAVEHAVARPLGLGPVDGAFAISEVVEENMANATRVHAVERGKEVESRALVAFGGAAPLHAARLAEKLGMGEVIVPSHAGIGSAIGFLLAPVAYEVVRSRYLPLAAFDAALVNRLFAEMRAEAAAIVGQGEERRSCDMRYRGQGHEISVAIPVSHYTDAARAQIAQLFDAAYRQTFGRSIPGLEVEVMSWTLRLAAAAPPLSPCPPTPAARTPAPRGERRVYDAASNGFRAVPVYLRAALAPGDLIAGPAIIAEDETSTFVSPSFDAAINALGYIVMTRRSQTA